MANKVATLELLTTLTESIPAGTNYSVRFSVDTYVHAYRVFDYQSWPPLSTLKATNPTVQTALYRTVHLSSRIAGNDLGISTYRVCDALLAAIKSFIWYSESSEQLLDNMICAVLTQAIFLPCCSYGPEHSRTRSRYPVAHGFSFPSSELPTDLTQQIIDAYFQRSQNEAIDWHNKLDPAAQASNSSQLILRS